MTAPWWQGLAPVSAVLWCGDDQHTLAWDRGELVARDHPDLDGDRTLAALGGTTHPCVIAIDTWARHAEDLRVLLLSSRGPTDRLRSVVPIGGASAGGPPGPVMASPRAGGTVLAGTLQPGPHRSFAVLPRFTNATGYAAAVAGNGSVPASVDEDLAGLSALLDLHGGLARRLAATVAAHWTERLEAGDPVALEHRAELHAALYGRVLGAARVWLDDDGLDVTVDLVAPGEARALTRRGDGIHVALPMRWVTEVWSSDLAIVAGRFGLAASRPTPDRIDVQSVGPDLESCTVSMSMSTSAEPEVPGA